MNNSSTSSASYASSMLPSGNKSRNFSTTSVGRVLGNSIWNAMYKSPLTNGFPKLGIPSLGTIIIYGMDRPVSGSFNSLSMTLPGRVLMITSRPSKCLKRYEKPVRAWLRLISCMTNKSAPFRLNSSCSFSWTTKWTSPVSRPGTSSANPENVIFWLLCMPLSTWTSMTFRSDFILAVLPCPLQSLQGRCICVIIPGPICRISMTAP
mmetsp:Transcript_39198/g.94768  ORF Transcript_39198/g.94768 Transcript_39198/m.94768 type:complete len:207 (-) Transcript_39198:746-1366(-)